MRHTLRAPFATRMYSSLLPLAAVAVMTATLHAQTDNQNINAQPAPIERSQAGAAGSQVQPQQGPLARYTSYTTSLAVGQVLAPTVGTATAQPAAGIYLRVAPHSAVRAVAIDAQHAEFKVERGLVNLSVHDPNKGQIVLIDLPGGQLQPFKNGFYTINAETNTVRTLKGEADVFVGSDPSVKPIKLKEDHAVTLPVAGATVAQVRSVEFYPSEARTDVIANPADVARGTDGPRYGYDEPYGGFYDYPYYAWGYPYGWGYGWGYPYGFGLGLGYGFYGGGFYGGGFRGRR